MKPKLGAVCSVAVGLIIATGLLWAHHSDAVYDMTRIVKIHGTVTQHMFVNPHQIVKMKVTDERGNVTPWILVGANVGSNRAAGWKKDTLKPGDEVTVWGFAYRDGKPNMTWNRIVQANGKLVPMPGGAKNEKLGRFLATYGKEQLSPEEYEEFKNLLNYTGRS